MNQQTLIGIFIVISVAGVLGCCLFCYKKKKHDENAERANVEYDSQLIYKNVEEKKKSGQRKGAKKAMGPGNV